MSESKAMEVLTEQHLKKILEDAYKKGSESTSVTTKQLVEEISNVLKPFVPLNKNNSIER
ncbi:hypothetical protein [Halalkalibacter okhensis]|uniref:Uncharacterized protein n=1 Tax=Halalkalibacter okhensis TaxID=333138 RepID=A0A0B0IE73_9BACI|nr:hypothetical protein [Halalkalibacter okhensis]KHF37966.1 hypothetical protein LQ50_24155 [Halalkalibacter okhensis]